MVELTEQSISTEALLRRVIAPESGAALLFVGTTRRWTHGVETAYLQYEAYREMALSEMSRLEEQARCQWNLVDVQIVHRLGEVVIGEVSIAIAVSSPHRKAAFQAGEWLIDQFKQVVPIWKKDFATPMQGNWIHPDSSSVEGECRSQAIEKSIEPEAESAPPYYGLGEHQ
jgi:molybdopterin synthase catalytic subunit